MHGEEILDKTFLVLTLITEPTLNDKVDVSAQAGAKRCPAFVFLGGGATSIYMCLYICGRKNWFRDYDLKSPNLCLGKSITVLLKGIAAINSVTEMKTTENA